MSCPSSIVTPVQTFKVSDTRKIATALPASVSPTTSPTTRSRSVSPTTTKGGRTLPRPDSCSKKGGGLRQRLELQVSRNRKTLVLRPRTDLDMSIQREEARTRKENSQNNWISINNPAALQYTDQIAMMKMLVIEAECFQKARGLASLKKEVTAAKDTKCDSSVLIRGLPMEIHPDGPLLFGKSAILALPLWHQEAANRKETVC